MAEFASNGKANTGVALGAVGTGLGVLNGLGYMGGLFGGQRGTVPGQAYSCNCNENTLVNRYEASQSARIAELETEVKLRDSNIYTDSKIIDLYKYLDGELKDIRNTLCGQAVMNQKTADSFEAVRNDMICCKNELYSAISRERDERCCGDNSIVTYANATFYPKQVADVTVGTTTTAQATYNPLPNCSCRCNDHR